MKYLFLFTLITVFTSSVKAQSTSLPLTWPGWATVEPFPEDLKTQIPINTYMNSFTFSGYGYVFGSYKTGSVTVYVKEMTAQGQAFVKAISIDVSGAQVVNGIPSIGSQLVQKDAQGNTIVITMVLLTRSVVKNGGSDTDPNNKLNWSVRPYRWSGNSGW